MGNWSQQETRLNDYRIHPTLPLISPRASLASVQSASSTCTQLPQFSTHTASVSGDRTFVRDHFTEGVAAAGPVS